MDWRYIVVCNDYNRDRDGIAANGAVMVTRRIWINEADAVAYAATLAPSRRPVVVQVMHPAQWREV